MYVDERQSEPHPFVICLFIPTLSSFSVFLSVTPNSELMVITTYFMCSKMQQNRNVCNTLTSHPVSSYSRNVQYERLGLYTSFIRCTKAVH